MRFLFTLISLFFVMSQGAAQTVQDYLQANVGLRLEGEHCRMSVTKDGSDYRISYMDESTPLGIQIKYPSGENSWDPIWILGKGQIHSLEFLFSPDRQSDQQVFASIGIMFSESRVFAGLAGYYLDPSTFLTRPIKGCIFNL